MDQNQTDALLLKLTNRIKQRETEIQRLALNNKSLFVDEQAVRQIMRLNFQSSLSRPRTDERQPELLLSVPIAQSVGSEDF